MLLKANYKVEILLINRKFDNRKFGINKLDATTI